MSISILYFGTCKSCGVEAKITFHEVKKPEALLKRFAMECCPSCTRKGQPVLHKAAVEAV